MLSSRVVREEREDPARKSAGRRLNLSRVDERQNSPCTRFKGRDSKALMSASSLRHTRRLRKAGTTSKRNGFLLLRFSCIPQVRQCGMITRMSENMNRHNPALAGRVFRELFSKAMASARAENASGELSRRFD
jgi:hypothetical protein